MFEPFLVWLYEFAKTEVYDELPLRDEPQMGTRAVLPVPWFDRLPSLVELPDAEPAMVGYRRERP